MENLSRTRRFALLTAAGAVFAVHLAVVIIVSVGWLVPSLFYVYIALFAATLYAELFLEHCPLTRLEFGIRRRLDPTRVFDTSCIMHYGRAFFGKLPRPSADPARKTTFLKAHSFVFVLSGVFVASLVYRFLVSGWLLS